jgi:hypothetical protein
LSQSVKGKEIYQRHGKDQWSAEQQMMKELFRQRLIRNYLVSVERKVI